MSCDILIGRYNAAFINKEEVHPSPIHHNIFDNRQIQQDWQLLLQQVIVHTIRAEEGFPFQPRTKREIRCLNDVNLAKSQTPDPQHCQKLERLSTKLARIPKHGYPDIGQTHQGSNSRERVCSLDNSVLLEDSDQWREGITLGCFLVTATFQGSVMNWDKPQCILQTILNHNFHPQGCTI